MEADERDEQAGGGEAAEPQASGEEKSDRDEGGPTRQAEETDETASGGAPGTRPSEFDPHE